MRIDKLGDARWRAVCLSLAVVATGVIWPAAPVRSATTPTRQMVGFSPGGPFLSQGDAGMKADLTRIKATGATFVRMDYTGNLAAYDHYLELVQAAGLKTLALPTYIAASGYEASLYAFAKRAIARGVRDFEIENEVNNPTYASRQDAASYTAQKLIPGARGIRRAASEAGVSVTIITSGLAPATGANEPLAFIKGVYAAGGQGSFDAVGWHPYTWPDVPTAGNAGWNTFLKTAQVYDVMRQNGDGAKKIWATEIGWPTSGGAGAIAESAMPGMIAAFLRDWFAADYAGPVMWYSLRDMGQPGTEGGFGLLRQDGSQKPGYAAFTAAVQALPAGGVTAGTPTPLAATPTPSAAPSGGRRGDLNGDGRVNIIDLSILLAGWTG